MRKLISLFLILLSFSTLAQQSAKISTFSRLLIFNDANHLMVVKTKGSGVWTTPGWYQDESSSIKSGLENLIASYGLETSQPALRGIFTLKSDIDASISTRIYFSTKVTGGKIISPDIVAEIQWLPIDQAMALISFPHINASLKQITDHPHEIWGGSMTMYKEDNKFKTKMLDAFYPISALK